jgi:hypothetical protein
MKRLAVLLSLLAVLALILATGNYKINAYQDVSPAVADGNNPPPPPGPVPPLFLADGNNPPPPPGPVPPVAGMNLVA